MALTRLAVPLCALAALTLAATPAPDPPLTWSINPNPPVAGETLTVSVTSAPKTPVKVDVYVDGTLIHSDWIKTVPGSTECDIDSDDEDLGFEVVVTSGAEQEEIVGTIVGS